MDEERQGRHVEREPLGFAGPVEKRLAEAFQFGRSSFGFFERLGVENLLDKLLALLAGWIRRIPV